MLTTITMKNITIKANDFFELLKLRDQSMWDVFASMIDGEEKEIVFLNDENQYLFLRFANNYRKTARG
jgi:predicted transcriptional regulator